MVSTHLKHMLVKLNHFPKDRGENKQCSKPPPSHLTIIQPIEGPSSFEVYWARNNCVAGRGWISPKQRKTLVKHHLLVTKVVTIRCLVFLGGDFGWQTTRGHREWTCGYSRLQSCKNAVVVLNSNSHVPQKGSRPWKSAISRRTSSPISNLPAAIL